MEVLAISGSPPEGRQSDVLFDELLNDAAALRKAAFTVPCSPTGSERTAGQKTKFAEVTDDLILFGDGEL